MPLRVGPGPRMILVLTWVTLVRLSSALPLAAGEPGGTSFLQVRLGSVTPDVLSASSESFVTVAATVTNVGDRPVRDVVARLEHGGAVATSSVLRTALTSGEEFQPVAEFATVAAQIERGQTAGVTFSVPVRSLGISQPGVYPILINVNGTPDGGAPSRLDEARFLLPVTGVPTDAGPAPDTTRPVPLTMLWPIADKPRLAPGVPGGTNPVRLMNDDLAVSLAPGGRLDTLLGGAEFATSPDAIDPSAGVDRTLCLAIDPDLLVTVNAMTNGYVVADAPDGLGTASHPGTGQGAATGWLDRLRNVARKLCVTATPYAQSDLDALHRIGDPGLSGTATTNGADVVDRILGITSLRGVTVVADGRLTEGGLALLSGQGPTVVIAAADSATAATGAPFTPDTTVHRLSPQVVLAPFDPAVGAALAAVGTDPSQPAYLDDALAVTGDHDSPAARRQDALAALLWRTLQPGVEPRAQILVPPLKWSPQPDDARAVLSGLGNAVRAGLAVPRPLTAVVTDSAAAPPEDQAELPTEVRGRFDDEVVETISAELNRLGQLTPALTTDQRTGLTGQQYTAPLREDMLRALSQTEAPDRRNEIAPQRLAVVGKTIEDLFGAVRVVSPGDSYTLATESSALPLALRNDLAVPIRVRLQIDAPPGMKVTDIGEQELPPGYLPLRVPVEVRVTQRLAVDVTLRTSDGVQLGEPVRLSVHANAYGKVLFAITLGGAVVLALLVGRRLYHRFRGQPDRADLDRPFVPAESASGEGE